MRARIATLWAAILVVGLIVTMRTAAVSAAAPIPDAPTQAAAQTDLVINEFMASNSSTLQDPDEPGEYPDWLELYNPSAAAVSLDGLFLVKGEQPDQVTFPITDGLSIPAGGFLIFYADDDPSQGPTHTNFRLNKDLDSIGLYGGVDATVLIDSRTFANQVTDYSEGRDPDGGPNWRLYSRPSPGRTNESRPPVVENVAHSPELPTALEPVTVSAVISDEGTIVRATIVYSITAGQILTAPMTLQENNRYAGVLPAIPENGAIVTYYVEAEDDNGEVTPNPSQGLPTVFRFPIGYTRPQVVINEFMADNVATLEDPDDPGDFADWIELYNPSSDVVSLQGLFLTDNPDNPTKFAITLPLTIDAGGYLIFYADEDPEQGSQHTNFKLNKDGESVAIYGALGTVEIDRIDFGDLPSNTGYGRFPDGALDGWGFRPCATPGAANIACSYELNLPFVTTR